MSTDSAHDHLRQGVGVFGATLLGLGSILGTGVYFGIPELTAQAGSSLIFPIIAAAILATCNALSSAQLAACYPVSGGTYEYGYRLLSPWAGFAAGWLFLCAKSASAAAAALQVTANLVSGPAPLLACAVVAAMTVFVVSGLRRSTWMNAALVAVAITGLAVFVMAASRATRAVSVSADNALATLDVRSFMEMAALMFVGFTGYGRVATLGEEIRNPRRNIPIAVVLTLFVSTILYLFVAAGVNQFLPVTEDDLTLTSLTASAGSTATWVVTVGAVAAMLGVLLNLLLGLSRVVLAMARRDDLPIFLATLNSSRTTPVFAVVLVAIAVVGIVLTRDSHAAWSLSAVTVLVYYSLTNLAALKLPPDQRLYPRWIAVVGLCGCLLLAAHVDSSSCLLGGSVLLVGLVARVVTRALKSSS